jgi:hypothetical protein
VQPVIEVVQSVEEIRIVGERSLDARIVGGRQVIPGLLSVHARRAGLRDPLQDSVH